MKRGNSALFRQVPAESCALLRAGLGVIGLIALIGLTPVVMYWVPTGLVPDPGDGAGIRSFLAAHGLGNTAGWTLWVVMVAAFALLTVGYRTRFVSPLCVLLLIVQAYLNRLPLSMAWQVEVCLLFYLMFTDSGAVLSLDAWLASSKVGNEPQQTTSLWPLTLMRYQIALIYFSSGLWKLVGTSWREGTALHFVLNNHLYARFPGPLSPHLEALAMVATYLTLAWELAFPLMLLTSVTRRLALLAGVVLHIGIWATMEVGLFSWVMLVGYLSFLDPRQVAEITHRVLRHLPSSPGLATASGT